MKYLACLLLLWALLPTAYSQAAAGSGGGRNPMADPFAAASPKVEAPIRIAPKVVVQAVAPVVVTRVSLPPGLRAILIRDNGRGLLASGDVGALSIPVTNGKEVRILDQDYRVEMTPTSIKLLSLNAGKVVWEGTLTGSASVPVPADISQMKYVPPLSAGVDPGLGGNGSGSRLQASPMIKITESH
jgi:hypothetical protein